MTKNVMKYGLMIIATMLVVAMAFAGAASADEISVDYVTWNSWGDDVMTHIGTNDTVKITGNGIIYPKFNGTSSAFVPTRNLTFDFADFHGSFAGEPSASESNLGALFGHIRYSTSPGPIGITIKNLTMSAVNVTPTAGQYQRIAGVIGYVEGTGVDNSTLIFTNCQLENCTIGNSAINGNVGGLVGCAENASVEVEGCSLNYCNVSAGNNNAGGLVGNASSARFESCSVENSSMYTSYGNSVGGLVGNSIIVVGIENCTVTNCELQAIGDSVGGLVGSAISAVNTVNNCMVRDSSISGHNNLGGLVGNASSVSFEICSVENSSMEARGGSIVGGVSGNANSTRFVTCSVANSSMDAQGASFVGGLVSNSIIVELIKYCTVTNCVLIADDDSVGGLVGNATSAVNNVTNCLVSCCSISGSTNVGGLVGNAESASGIIYGNYIRSCAVSGTNSTTVRSDCGGMKPIDFGCTVSDSYLSNGLEGQPIVAVYRPGEDFATVYRKGNKSTTTYQEDAVSGAICLVKPVGVKAAESYVGYANESLELKPWVGSNVTYNGTVQFGATTITVKPIPRAGYIFNGWNLTSKSGTMLTNESGYLQANVDGYTNESSKWKNVSGVTVNLYANWTAIEYNNSVDKGVATFSEGLPVEKVIVGSANPNITNVTFEFMGAPAEIATKPSGYKSTATINDAFDLTITGTQDADVTVFFNATGSGPIFLAHMKNGAIWEFLKATPTGNPNEYKVNITKESGFSPFQIISAVSDDPTYTPISSKHSGSTVILPDGVVPTTTPTVAPTAEPTPATPSVIATEVQTTQPTQQSPAPVVGVLAGLGVAAVLLRQRK